MTVMFTCSIDDGHPSDMKMAALLNKHKLKGTFYIPIKNREGAPVMTHAQMREIARQFELGSHTYDHCFLNSVDRQQAYFQILEGKQELEDILGSGVEGFCYPGGKYRREHIDLVRRAGFHYARTTMNLCFAAGGNRFEMSTTCQFYPHPRSVYARNFVRSGKWLERCSGLTLALAQENWINRIHALFDYACEQGTVFHLWAHSGDIDKLDAWQELDDFFSYVDARTSLQGRVDNSELSHIFHPLERQVLRAPSY
jgi:peptidoglycan/xylan/chitin deacetylase (PgdA/CDA1 family)